MSDLERYFNNFCSESPAQVDCLDVHYGGVQWVEFGNVYGIDVKVTYWFSQDDYEDDLKEISPDNLSFDFSKVKSIESLED